MEKNYDFAGWATKANLLCSDGRIIQKNAFEHCDGMKVPLVWNHVHNSPEEVLGHALLENRDEGVYAYCYFNDTDSARHAKECVQHGDINQLSIFANKLKQLGNNVIHGMIREVSLVHCGANPGAYIESIIMHSDDSCEEGNIYTGEFLDYIAPLSHADDKKGKEEMADEVKKTENEQPNNADDDKTIHQIIEELTPTQKKAVFALVGMAIEDGAGDSDEEPVKHSDDDDDGDDEDKTIEEIIDELTPTQQKAVYALVGMAMEDNENENDDDDDNEGGNTNMKHNIFDQETNTQEVLSHSEMQEIFADAQRLGSLKEAVLAHGIEEIDILFPDAKAISEDPTFIKRNDDWVAKVLGGVHHSPFARVKTIHADITKDAARAKGYTKGNLKIEEVFKLLKRVTNPTTVYKKQKLDRDDLLDITDFNVLPWLKGELRMMLDEELARAYLIGDGRNPVDEADDKIDEECIRPIWKMEDLFTVKTAIEVAADATAEEKAKAFITACVKSRKEYKGSGNPSMFITEDLLTDCLLIEDKNGRVIYDTLDKLAARLRVKEIIPVPVMENQTRTVEDKVHTLGAIYVNLKDYNVGTNKGGEITMFDDFDIDYNQYKYLMETRCSGTLTVPFSAVALEFVEATA